MTKKQALQRLSDTEAALRAALRPGAISWAISGGEGADHIRCGLLVDQGIAVFDTATHTVAARLDELLKHPELQKSPLIEHMARFSEAAKKGEFT